LPVLSGVARCPVYRLPHPAGYDIFRTFELGVGVRRQGRFGWNSSLTRESATFVFAVSCNNNSLSFSGRLLVCGGILAVSFGVALAFLRARVPLDAAGRRWRPAVETGITRHQGVVAADRSA
jgi:hypothetical protein